MSLDMYLATLIVLCLSAFAGCTNITVSDDMGVTESMSISGKHTAVVAAQHEKTSHDIYIQDGKTGDGTAVAVEAGAAAGAEETAEASVPTSDPPPSSSGSNSKSEAASSEADKKSQEHTSSGGMGIALSLACVLVAAIGTTHL